MSALTNSIFNLENESGGTLAVHVIRSVDSAELFAAAARGDETAQALAQAVLVALNRVESAPRHLPALCGCCDNHLRNDFAICVAVAYRDDPGSGIAFGICASCGTEITEIHRSAVQALCRIWPDARPIPLANWHEGGRA